MGSKIKDRILGSLERLGKMLVILVCIGLVITGSYIVVTVGMGWKLEWEKLLKGILLVWLLIANALMIDTIVKLGVKWFGKN